MKAKTLRHLIIALLLASGVFHLALALFTIGDDQALGMTIFGVIYIALSFFARADVKDGSISKSRNAIIGAILICAMGAAFGVYGVMNNTAPDATPLIVVVDLVIIVAGVMWFLKRTKRA